MNLRLVASIERRSAGPEREHPPGGDPHVLGLLHEALPIWAIARHVDVEQRFSETRGLLVGEVNWDSAAVNGHGQMLAGQVRGADRGVLAARGPQVRARRALTAC